MGELWLNDFEASGIRSGVLYILGGKLESAFHRSFRLQGLILLFGNHILPFGYMLGLLRPNE